MENVLFDGGAPEQAPDVVDELLAGRRRDGGSCHGVTRAFVLHVADKGAPGMLCALALACSGCAFILTSYDGPSKQPSITYLQRLPIAKCAAIFQLVLRVRKFSQRAAAPYRYIYTVYRFRILPRMHKEHNTLYRSQTYLAFRASSHKKHRLTGTRL